MSFLVDQSQMSNTLLAGLKPELFAALAPHLEAVSLAKSDVLESLNAPVLNVYFPGPSVISVVASTTRAVQIETGLIGPEGMTGLPLLYGVDSAQQEVFVQIPCRALRITANKFREVLAASVALHHHLLRYAYAFSIQVAQTALSNGRFTIRQRLARWLLMSHDRIDRDDITLTQEFLSFMLGVRRAGVTNALSDLVTVGAIDMHRGMIIIRDRAILLDAAGAAYGTPEEAYASIMTSPASSLAA